MGQEGAAGDVADGIDGGVGGLLFFIDVNEPLVVERNLGVFQPQVVRIGRAANRHQHPIVKFLPLLAVQLKLDFDLLAARRHFAHPGLEADFLEQLLRVGDDRPRQVRVRSRQNRVQRFHQHDLAAERGIDGAQLHPNVAATNDQQLLRDFFNFQRLGGGHDPGVAKVESLGHGGYRPNRHNGMLVIDELLSFGGFNPESA